MTVDEKIFSAFKHACTKNAMKVSSKVELMMRDFLENYDPETPRTKPEKKRRDGNDTTGDDETRDGGAR